VELSLEDRISDEVWVILEDMRKGGVSYPEMFKKVKMKMVTSVKGGTVRISLAAIWACLLRS